MPVYPGAPPVPAATFRTFHAPYAGRFLGAALPGSSPLPWPSPGLPRARLLLVRPKAGTNDAAGFASCCGPLSCSPRRAFDAGLRPGPSPDRAASPLPGLLAATRTGLTPAGDDELALDQVTSQHHLQLWAHKEQDVEPLPEDRVDGEEVALKDCGRLLTQELPPADARSSRCGLDPVPVKNVPNTARRQRHPQRDQLALDALVSPAWVLRRQTQDQLLRLPDQRRSARTPTRIAPAAT